MKYNTLNQLLEYLGAESMWSLGRSLYKSSCGVWTAFYFKNGKCVCYEDSIAHTYIPPFGFRRFYFECLWKTVKTHALRFWRGLRHSQCIGIEIGSIVEGSEVYVDGKMLEFPFDGETLDATIKSVDEEVAFYWNRDNTTNHQVTNGEDAYFVSWTNFDSEPKWFDGMGGDCVPLRSVEVAYHAMMDDSQSRFDLKGWTCKEWLDDSTY